MTIKWGIIGCGNIAKTFVSSAKYLSEAVLYGCAASEYSRAQVFAEEQGVEQAFANYDALLSSPDIDAIYVATTHNFHYQHIKQSLMAGKHVLSEKPITLNAQQAKNLYGLAQERNLLLMEAVWTRFLPAILELQSQLKKGVIGNIKHISVQFNIYKDVPDTSRLRNLSLAGGALLDLGIYPITFSDIVMDAMPETITGNAVMTNTGVDETSSYQLGYQGGVTANLVSSFLCDPAIEANIYGEKGRIKVPHFLGAQGFQIFRDNQLVDQFTAPFSGDKNFYFEIAHFQQCLAENKQQSPILPPSKSLRIMQIMDELRAKWGLRYPDEEI
ncbi:Gfo/Idh/MocA family protein [Glaciecola sp. 1036]|uniref:Gfo/Idh/MocA family protein n=1 Tax=Alteromonadaceae TaxID=72275 RepID=UPI003D04B1A2